MVVVNYVFTIGKFDSIKMTFFSSSIVVMLLLSITKVYTPRFNWKIKVRDHLNVVKFLVQTILIEFSFPF